ncbi:MAG: AAA family ATPase, partial [Pseudomonadota bacterium]
MSCVIAITGTPGVGKTTICRLLAERIALSAHVEADELQRFIVAGGQWPSAGTKVAHAQLLLRTRNAATLAA